jgi:hypothetical protein
MVRLAVTVLRRGCYATVLAAVLGATACVAQIEGAPDDMVETGDETGGSGSGGGSGTTPRTTITVRLHDRPADGEAFGMYVAVRDGSGPWQLAPSGEMFTFDVASPTWGIVWTCNTVSIPSVVFAYFATSEATSYTRTIHPSCSDRQMTRMSLAGSISNMPTTSTASWVATYGDASASVVRETTAYGTFDFGEAEGVLPGPHDLVAWRTLPSVTAIGNYVSKAAVLRGVTSPTSAAAINWTSSGIRTASVTYSGMAAEQKFSTMLYTANGTAVSFGSLQSPARSATGTFETSSLSSGQAAAGDVYMQQLVLAANDAMSVTLETWETDVATRTLTSPAPLGTVITSADTSTPFPKIHTRWNAYPNAAGYVITSRQARSSGSVMWNGVVGAGYLGSTPAIQPPDLSELPGWETSFELEPGIEVTGQVSAIVSTGGTADVPFRVPAPAGTDRMIVAQAFTATP